MGRGLAQKRKNRHRVIQKRLKIITAQDVSLGGLLESERKEVETPGLLDKHNLTCGCEMCTRRSFKRSENKAKRQQDRKSIQEGLQETDG